jgi:hypothetical protein
MSPAELLAVGAGAEPPQAASLGELLARQREPRRLAAEEPAAVAAPRERRAESRLGG